MLIATTWFPGSAWEHTELQTPPAFATIEPEDAGGGASKTVRSQAEPWNEHVILIGLEMLHLARWLSAPMHFLGQLLQSLQLRLGYGRRNFDPDLLL